MHRIWRVVLEPILRAVRPRVLVETGSDGAEIHRCLLDFCREAGATLVSVEDPEEALADIERVDAFVVARETTWHSVSGLLDRIDDWRVASGRPFPLVILNGARSSRYEVTSNGARVETSGLVTAIESFLTSSNLPVDFVSVPVLGGMGILLPRDLRASRPRIDEILERIKFLEDMEREETERLSVDRAAIERRDERIEQLMQEKEDLQVWFEELASSTRQILNSRRWKVGNAVAELQRRILLKRRSFRGHLESRVTIDQFKEWRSGRLTLPESRRLAVLGMRAEAPREASSLDLEAAGVSVDVVVCVHNALEDVQECLTSVVESCVPERHRLLVVNDGSDEATTNFLHGFATRHRQVEIILGAEEAEGYTKAANRGLRESGADYVILLNSDTVVPRSWIEGIVECGESDPRIGIVGPLSNAASWQSVPDLNHNGKWAVNELPIPDNIEDSDELIRLLSPCNFPRVPFLNGFCYAIKRKVLQSVGYLDEQAFPRGYGEEDDYSYRARRGGFQLAVADHTLVFHKKSKSFGTQRRDELAKAGQKVLRRRYGATRLQQDSKLAKDTRALRLMRERVRMAGQTLRFRVDSDRTGEGSVPEGAAIASDPMPAVAQTTKKLCVTYLLPSLRIRGGVLSVVQLVNGLVRLGVDANLVVRSVEGETSNWHFAREPIVLESDDDLRDGFPESDIAVATHWTTAETVAGLVDAGRATHAAYYLQDYEAWFYSESQEEIREQVIESYGRIDRKIVTSEWLRSRLAEHGHNAAKIVSGTNLEMFYPRSVELGSRPRVLAFTRFSTPRRGFVHAIETLRRVAETDPAVEIVLFGEDLSSFQIPFPHVCAGLVSDPNRLAELYSSANILLDSSNFHGFGRPALEAMGCGTPCVLTDVGGIHEYARSDENCRLVRPGDPDAAAFEVIRILSDPDLAERLRQGGFRTVEQLDLRDEVHRMLGYFQDLAASVPFERQPVSPGRA